MTPRTCVANFVVLNRMQLDLVHLPGKIPAFWAVKLSYDYLSSVESFRA